MTKQTSARYSPEVRARAVRMDAHCATIVGDWEEPSGESRLEPQERTIKDVRE